MFSDDFRMIFELILVIFGDFLTFQVHSECFRMIPERSRSFSERFGAMETLESQIFQKVFADQLVFFDRQIICWESFEMDFGGVPMGSELILRGRRSFEVWRTAVFERSESSEASRAKRVQFSSTKFCF